MKVLYILSSSSTFGGSTKSFLRMLSELQNREMEIHVVCPDRGPAYEILQQRGIQTFVVPTRFHTYPQWNNWQNCVLFLPRLIKHLFINHHAYRCICSLCEQYHYDIIHTNVSVVNVGERAARRYGIPHVYHIREYQDLDFGMHMIPCRKAYLKHLQRSNCVCITRDIQKHFELEESNAIVVYNGIRYQKELVYRSPKEDYFLFVGRIDPSKGFDMVLYAFEKYRCHDSSMKLYVAGMFIDDNFRQSVEMFINQHQLNDYICFGGLRNDVDTLMQRAKACIIASPFEGFGLVMAEAMFNGCLVLAKQSCGTKEQLDNGTRLFGDSIALSYETTDELSSLMLEVSLHDEAYYEKMIKLSQRVVSSLYTVENNANKIYNFYTRCI